MLTVEVTPPEGGGEVPKEDGNLKAYCKMVEVAGGPDTNVAITIEIEVSTKPACDIESLSRWFD